MGGIICAKYVLCHPPAMARAKNKTRLEFAHTQNEKDLKEAMLKGLSDLREYVENGTLTPKQIQLFNGVMAVLDGDDKTFNAAYSKLRESLIVPASDEVK